MKLDLQDRSTRPASPAAFVHLDNWSGLPLLNRWFALLFPLGASAVAFTLWCMLTSAELRLLAGEGGLVERMTELLYFAMAVAFAVTPRLGAPGVVRHALVIVMLACGAREMDLHKAWTEKSVLKLSFYSGDAGWGLKLVAALVVVSALAAIGLLLRKYAATVWKGWRHGSRTATTVLVFGASMAFSKLLDRSPALLAESFGVVVPEPLFVLVGAFEELIELSLPMVVFVGWWQHLQDRVLNSKTPA